MSRVFLATETALGRKVVIKVLPADLAGSINVDRFRREIATAARLNHPHIVPVLTAGDIDGLPYLVMPFVDGETLRARLAGGELPLEEAVWILRDVAKALAYAHEHGVVHRDVKPDNVLITGGAATVTDFGVAKALGESSAAGGSLTATGVALGTPGYMAPEQASGDPTVDQRADIYAFGVLAFEVLSGAPPFAGRGTQQTIMAHITEPPPDISLVRPTTPTPLAALVMRCLEKRPADRPQHADELLRTLDVVATQRHDTPAVAVQRARPSIAIDVRAASRQRGVLGFVAAAIVVAGIGVGVWRRGAVKPLDDRLLVVAPFHVASNDPSVRLLREGMADLLAAKLTGNVRAVDPRTVLNAWRKAGGSSANDIDRERLLSVGRALGAARVLEGSIVQTPQGSLTITGAIVPVQSPERAVQTRVEGQPTAVASLVDTLTAKLLALSAGEGEKTAAALAGIPFDALQAYLAGHAAYRAGRYVEAAQAFRRAVDSDSTFAQAALHLSLSTAWLPFSTLGTGARDLAWRHRDKLSPTDQLLLGPARPAACVVVDSFYQRAVATAPDVPELWFELGDNLLHCGAQMDVPNREQRSLAAFERAMAIDPGSTVVREHVPLLYAVLGDTARADRMVQGDTEVGAVFNRYLIHHGPAEFAAFVRQPAFAAGGFSSWAAMIVGEPAQAETALKRLESSAVTNADRVTFERAAARLALYAGQPLRAASYRNGRTAGDRVLDALFWDGDSAAAVQQMPALRAALDGPLSRGADDQYAWVVKLLALGETSLDRGDTMVARRAEQVLSAVPPGEAAGACARRDSRIIAAHRAVLLKLADARQAVEALDSILGRGEGMACRFEEVGDLVAARLWERLGDLPRAYAATRRERLGTEPWNYYSTFLRERGRLGALTGDTANAIKAYRLYVAIRANAEPALRPDVENARRELARLTKSAGR